MQDLVEFFFDLDFDEENVAKVTINSTGAVTDALRADHRSYPKDWDYSWNLESESAGHVGDDYLSSTKSSSGINRRSPYRRRALYGASTYSAAIGVRRSLAFGRSTMRTSQPGMGGSIFCREYP